MGITSTSRHFVLDERFRPMRFPGALPEVGVDDLLQVIDVACRAISVSARTRFATANAWW